jgi:hypothetical protein
MNTRLLTFAFFLLLFSLKSLAQVDLSKALTNPVIRKNYAVEELVKYYNESPDKFKQRYLYYTASFIVQSQSNEYTEHAFTDSIKDNFDVSLYEFNRKEKERFDRHYDKLGFSLILLSREEFQQLIDTYILDSINFSLPAGFPGNVNSTTYAADKQLWIDNNQAAYNEYIERCNRKINIISQEEFNNLPLQKQNVILANPEIYIVY